MEKLTNQSSDRRADNINNIKCPFLPSLPKYEQKSVFSKIFFLLQA